MRTYDKWSEEATREKINTVGVTFTFDCTEATLTSTAANTLTSEQDYIVEADGATAAITDSTTVDFSVSGCKGRNEINTMVEIWH